MIEPPLGLKLRQLRENAQISLRALAKRLKVSAAFLSDVELGRRHPSARILAAVAKSLKVSVEELNRYDSRLPLSELRILAQADPRLGIAFRAAINDVNTGRLTPEELLNRIRGPSKR
jgi:transcriptional regulator with XRE-family HTH domain